MRECTTSPTSLASRRTAFPAWLLPALLAFGLPMAGRSAPAIPAPVDTVGAAASPAKTSKESPPEGLARSDWSGIRAAHQQWKHRFRQEEDGSFSARNAGQQWDTVFDGRGFLARPDHGEWEWGLALRGYGLGQEQVALSGREPEERRIEDGADGDVSRLAYQRDANLEEWFRNDSRGLEQGWTLAERPTGPADEKLTLDLAVRGDLRPETAGSDRTVRFVDRSDTAALTYGGLKAWDAEGRALEARFVPSEASLRIEIDDRNAVYPVTIDPVAQQAYLKAFNTGAEDRFGHAVAVDGDTVVVGAAFEDSAASAVDGDESDNSAENAGAAYVFVRSGTAWSQQAYLKASNSGAHDWFGASVSVSGDTVVVGASNEDSDANVVNGPDNNNHHPNSGAAYVFVRSGTTWSQQAYLKASNADQEDNFGWSVSVDGDTAVVGAWIEDGASTGVDGPDNNDATGSGAAYVFARNGTTWSQQAYLKASNTGQDDRFGFSVSVDGDTAVVGAITEDSSATGVNPPSNDNSTEAGAAYVFVRSGTSWSQQAYLKASNPDAHDWFGLAVAVDGDTVVVGAPQEDSSANAVDGDESDNSAGEAGAAYVFVRSGTAWSQQAYLKASYPGAIDNFGVSLSVSGDLLLVGALGDDSAATGVDGDGNDNSAGEAGAAYVFARSGSTWSQQAYLKASNAEGSDLFGHSVSVDGDTAVVSAPVESSGAIGVDGDENDNSATESGAAYIFHLPPAPPAPPAPPGSPAPTSPTTSTAGPDTVSPSVSFLKRSRLRNPRPRHRIVGTAADDVAVARVEVRVRGKGWRRARLRGERWLFRTPRLESGRRNVFKVRAEDTSGNRSRPKRVRVVGR